MHSSWVHLKFQFSGRFKAGDRRRYTIGAPAVGMRVTVVESETNVHTGLPSLPAFDYSELNVQISVSGSDLQGR